MCLSHSRVVALGEVGAELRAARLLALERRDHGGLRAVDHVAELDRAEHVLVEDRAAVVDPGALGLLAQAPDRLQRALQPRLVAEHGRVLVHRFRRAPSLISDTRRPSCGRAMIASMRAASSRSCAFASTSGIPMLAARAGRVFARAPAEDQRVEQRVGAEAVAAVDRHARDLAGRVQALDRRAPVDVGLDAAHDVVLAGADHDRFARDVDAGEVACRG